MNIVKYDFLHPALLEYVESIIYMSQEEHENLTFRQTALPNHECYLSFEFDTDFQVKKYGDHDFSSLYHSTIIPPQFLTTELRGKKIKSVMVKFKIGGFYRLFKIPIPTFNNRCYNANEVFDCNFLELYNKIADLAQPILKIKAVEDFLLQKVLESKPYTGINFAIETIQLNQGNISIADLASKACLSLRQMQRNFIDQVGLSPKRLSKFVRCNNARNMKALNPHLTWGEVSIRCGYFDQMHLIHDFKTLLGITPYDLTIIPTEPLPLANIF